MIINKLKQLSNQFKELGQMHPSYKAFASHSSVSTEMQKAVLDMYLDQISLIMIDYNSCRVRWINKHLYQHNDTACIYFEDTLIFARHDKIDNVITFYGKFKPNMLMDMLENINIFDCDKYIIHTNLPPPKDTFFWVFKAYITNNNETSVSQSERLRYITGEVIYDELTTQHKTPSEIADEFDKRILNHDNKITYVLC